VENESNRLFRSICKSFSVKAEHFMFVLNNTKFRFK